MLQTEKKFKQKYNNYTDKKSQKQQKNGKYILIYVFFLVLISIILVTYIGESVKITRLNYKINQLEDEYENVKSERHQLQLKLARDSSLARIEQKARADLNMKEPETMQVVVLDKQNKDKEMINNSDESLFLVFQIFDNFLERLGTVKANSPD